MAAQDEPSPLSSSASSPPSRSGDKDHATAAAEAPVRPPPRKRRRIIISCTECHRRKQKCDRNLPCTNCVSRNKQDSCRYETGAPTAKAASKPRAVRGQEDQQRDSTASSLVLDGGKRQRGSIGQSSNGDQHGSIDASLDPRLAASTMSPVIASGSGALGGMSPSTEPIASSVNSANFGYSSTGSSTLGFLKQIDRQGSNNGESLSSLATGKENTEYFGTRERYKSLVRQLPARPYIEKLVDIYFKDFNWQYNGVDRYVFDRQMEDWYRLPFNVLNTAGPQALPPDLRAFPALVFQVIATALMILPPGPDPTFDSLKYTGSMSFDDLAADYSESGVALLALLGKRQVSHTAVIADWLRAAFLKYSGLITESWHAIGSAIRDAQECGLHMNSQDPKPKSDRLEDVLENQWEIQRRRRTWSLLRCWDIHTGVVLGRPVSIDLNASYTLPVDAPEPKDPSRTPVTPRSENDPPCLMTRTLWILKLAMGLKGIIELEKDGPCPKDFSKVDRVHEQLVDLEAQTPAYFRHENPDTRFDNVPGCFWIPMVREQLHPLVWFNFMALHRPYIFTRPHSRREALKASLSMLDSQKINFANLHPRHYKTFQLFFGTFDAVVLMASIFILFPKDNSEYIPAALQHFQWAVERFEAMSERNRLAAAARRVLQAIHYRLVKALNVQAPSHMPLLGIPKNDSATVELSGASTGSDSRLQNNSINNNNIQNTGSVSTTGESPSLTNFTGPGSGSGSGSTRGTSIFTTPGESGDPGGSIAAGGAFTAVSSTTPIDPGLTAIGDNDDEITTKPNTTSDWSLPEGFDWSSIQPVYAIADVAYNDLMGFSSGGEATMGTGGGSTSMPHWAGGTPLLNEAPNDVGEGDAQGWLFGGDFGNDSVWSLLNQYPPPY